MVSTTLIVEENVASKLDWRYIEEQLSNVVAENVVLSFVCVDDDWRKEDTWKYKGKKFYRIILPYERVVKMSPDEVRQLMLRMAEERLGLLKAEKQPFASAENGRQ